MMRAVSEFLRDWRLLLYWVFFKPTALREHVRQLAPEHADERTSLREFLHVCRDNHKLKRFLLRTLIFALLTWLVGALLTDLITTALWSHFNWLLSLGGFSFFVAFGAAFFVAIGVADSVAGRVAEGVAASVAAGVVIGVVVGVAAGVAAGVVVGVGVGVAVFVVVGVVVGVVFVVGSGVAEGVAYGVVISVTAGVVVGVGSGVGVGIAVGVVVGVGALRLPVYLLELWAVWRAYRRSLRGDKSAVDLWDAPVGFDELLVLPQPMLAVLLRRAVRADLNQGLHHLGRVASNPFQRWAAQKALRHVLEKEGVSFWVVLDRLLIKPEPYVQTGDSRDERARAADRYYTTKLLLAELLDRWPKPKRDAYRYWPNDYLLRAMTFWLRRRGPAEHADLAAAYFRLLHEAEWFAAIALDDETEGPVGFDEDEMWPLPAAVAVLADARGLPHGEEFYQTLRLIEAGLRCVELQNVAKLRDEFAPLFVLAEPLRPHIVAVFRHLRNAAIDAAAFLTAAHELTRRDALLKAQSALEEARQSATEVYEPERSLLLAAIEHWRRQFAIEGGRVAEQREVETLPNPYIAGRPIRPEDGQLFAGRRDEMKQIEEKLQTGVGLVICGQRRIGKSSILLHLPEHLPHDLLPVYLNLQRLMANTTGGFLDAVGKEIVKQLNPPSAIRHPPSAEFDREPYLSFDHLLNEIETQLQPGQRVLLSFDEFEELEQRVQAGKIEKEIFSYLRGVAQTGSRFALLFAGLHTLEQMTREYWNPFFQSVQTIRVGYLSELDARQLITDPIERFPLAYDEEAIDRIAALTNSHPYLTQSVCHNLINRLNDPLNRSNRVTRADVDAVLDRTLETSGYYFDDYVWGWSDADERLALALIAEAGEEAAFAAVEKHLSRESALQATASLKQRDIINERTAGGELIFRFRIPLSRLWVLRMQSSARLLLERTTRQ